MTRNEALGEELIRHHNKISDINSFFDFVEARDLKPGKVFLLNTDAVYCALIDYNNLQIQYTYNKTEFAQENELFYVPQIHING